MATKLQLQEQLQAANDELIAKGRLIEQLRGQVARLQPVGYRQQQRLPLGAQANRSAVLTAEARRQIAPAYFRAFPDARSATDEELRNFDEGAAQ